MRRPLTFSLLLLALLASACSSDSGGSAEESGETTPADNSAADAEPNVDDEPADSKPDVAIAKFDVRSSAGQVTVTGYPPSPTCQTRW